MDNGGGSRASNALPRREPKFLSARYHPVSQEPPREEAYVEKLLATAAGWRQRATGTTDPYLGDVMRRAAEELERAAARVTRRARVAPSEVAT
jgi:hypothetical protein